MPETVPQTKKEKIEAEESRVEHDRSSFANKVKESVGLIKEKYDLDFLKDQEIIEIVHAIKEGKPWKDLENELGDKYKIEAWDQKEKVMKFFGHSRLSVDEAIEHGKLDDRQNAVSWSN